MLTLYLVRLDSRITVLELEIWYINTSNITLIGHYYHLAGTELFQAINKYIYHQKTSCNERCLQLNATPLQNYSPPPPPKNSKLNTNGHSLLKTVTEAEGIIYLEHKLQYHVSSHHPCYRPSPASSIFTWPSCLSFPKLRKGLFCCCHSSPHPQSQSQSKLCQALTKEAREINPAL